MAPLPVIADVYRLSLHWNTGVGPYAVNVMHFFDNTGASGKASLNAAFQANWTNDMCKVVSADASADLVNIIKLDGTDATSTYATGSGAKWTGDGNGDFAPALASIVKFRTGLRGREHRGRIYLPFVAENMNVLGVLDGTAVIAQQAAWTTFVGDMAADSWELVVASYKLAAAVGVTDAVVESIGATQRRRQTQQRR